MDKVRTSLVFSKKIIFRFVLCSTIGDDVNGIWPKDVKKDHINCAHATSSNIITGDDQGAVKLFKFPCPEAGVSRLI